MRINQFEFLRSKSDSSENARTLPASFLIYFIVVLYNRIIPMEAREVNL